MLFSFLFDSSPVTKVPRTEGIVITSRPSLITQFLLFCWGFFNWKFNIAARTNILYEYSIDDVLRDYYMTFSISALVLARDSHIKPDSGAGGLIWVEG